MHLLRLMEGRLPEDVGLSPVVELAAKVDVVQPGKVEDEYVMDGVGIVL